MKQLLRSLRGRLRKRHLGNHGVGYIAETEQGVFALDPLDYGITNHLLRDGSSAPHFVRFLTNFINSQSTVVFVGAHIGVYVVPIAKIAERVYGYESDPRNYRYLEYNLRLNSCNNVECFNLAVGDTARTVAVQHNQANSGGSTISIDPSKPFSSTTGPDSTVEMISLDRHAERFGDRIDLLVMDIEGAESLAIKGMGELLQKVHCFCVEYCCDNLQRMGSSKEEFVELLRDKYQNMYLYEDRVYSFKDGSWIDFVHNDAKQGSYVYNFFFTNSEFAIQI